MQARGGRRPPPLVVQGEHGDQCGTIPLVPNLLEWLPLVRCHSGAVIQAPENFFFEIHGLGVVLDPFGCFYFGR